MNDTIQKSIRQRKGMRGFTLIELMIVVVVIAVLAAIAYPSYRDQVRRTKRSDGKAVLMDTAQRLERCYTRFSSYDESTSCDVSLPVTSEEDYYVVSGTRDPSSFALVATAQGDQADDTECATLTLNSAGQQGSLGETTDTNGCW